MSQTTAHVLTSGCKVNLYLHVGDKLANGYHELETLFLPLATPHDTLTVQVGSSGNANSNSAQPMCTVACEQYGIDEQNNTLTKAYAAYAKATGFCVPLHITLTKGVPHGAGLGGGSANAAKLLLFLQEEAQKHGYTPLDNAALNALSAGIGADVPFFLENVPAVATGIGEKLTRVKNPYEGYTILVICAPIHISTGWAFNQLDNLKRKNTFFKKNCLTYFADPYIYTFVHAVQHVNDFEEVVYPQYPELLAIRNALLESGAEVALLSGTGSSIFGLFAQKTQAEKATQVADIVKYTTYLTSV